MPLPWIKMWVEALDDPKLTRMSLAERGAWWGILKLARKCDAGNKIVSGGEGLSVDEIAEALHIKTDEDRQALESMITKMGKRGSLKWTENTLAVVHWEERQRIPPSAEREAVAERVRKYRERQKRLGETPEVISEMAERPRARDSKKATRSGDSEEATRVPRVRASQGGQPGDSEEATRSQGGQPGDGKEATRSQDKEIMAVWSGIKNFPPVSKSLARSFLAEMRAEFPDVDLLEESKTFAAAKLSDPLTMRSMPFKQLRTWMLRARQFQEGKGQKPREKKGGKKDYTSGKYGHMVRR